MYNVFRISYTILNSSQQCKLQFTGCHTYTYTHIRMILKRMLLIFSETEEATVI